MTEFLDAFAELNAAFGDQDDVVMLPLDLIDEDPHQPRETFDARELADLAETVRRRGVLQPIVVRPADVQGRYCIRFGARRYRAARLAGLSEVRALVRGGEASDADLLIEQVLENEQRAALTTAERARTVERLLGLGMTQAEISRELTWPKDVVSMLASVSTMPPRLQTLARQLGVRTLYALHGAWKTDPTRADAWLEGRDPDSITQAQARELAAAVSTWTAAPEPPASVGSAPAPASGKAHRAAASPVDPQEAVAARGRVVVEVAMGARTGVLDLDRAPGRAGEAWVRFAGTRTSEAVSIGALALVRVGPPSGETSASKAQRKG